MYIKSWFAFSFCEKCRIEFETWHIVHVFNLFERNIHLYQHIEDVKEKKTQMFLSVSSSDSDMWEHISQKENHAVSPFRNYDLMHACLVLLELFPRNQYNPIPMYQDTFHSIRMRQVNIFSEDRPNLLWAVLKCIPIWF